MYIRYGIVFFFSFHFALVLHSLFLSCAITLLSQVRWRVWGKQTSLTPGFSVRANPKSGNCNLVVVFWCCISYILFVYITFFKRFECTYVVKYENIENHTQLIDNKMICNSTFPIILDSVRNISIIQENAQIRNLRRQRNLNKDDTCTHFGFWYISSDFC